MPSSFAEYYINLKKERISCPVCSSTTQIKLYNNDRYNMGIQTVICNSCSMIYINPRPTETEMLNFYKNHYREVYEAIERPTEDYINKGPFIPRAEYVINTLKSFFKSAETFLDIGCAEGTLIKKVEKEFPSISTYGVEPSKTFGQYAKEQINGEIFIGGYKEFIKNSKELKVDIVTTTHVLEHILDPNLFLKSIQRVMHSDSLLYIEVPNIMSEKVRGLGAIHLGHVLSFDPLTLRLLLENVGFEIIEVFTEDLPAKTPAMAITCRLTNKIQTSKFPTQKTIERKASLFKERILGEKPKSVISNKKSFLTNIKRRLFDD